MAALIGLLLWSLSPSQEMLVSLIQTTRSIVSEAGRAADLPVLLHVPLRDKHLMDSQEGIVAHAALGATNSKSSAPSA